jgi:hypothetical protein
MLAVPAVVKYDITSEMQKYTKSSGTVSVQLRLILGHVHKIVKSGY